MWTTGIYNFFFQPITKATLTRDGILLFDLVRYALILASAALFFVHIPSITLVVIAGIALMHGRMFATAFAILCAIAWFNWLWGITPPV